MIDFLFGVGIVGIGVLGLRRYRAWKRRRFISQRIAQWKRYDEHVRLFGDNQ